MSHSTERVDRQHLQWHLQNMQLRLVQLSRRYAPHEAVHYHFTSRRYAPNQAVHITSQTGAMHHIGLFISLHKQALCTTSGCSYPFTSRHYAPHSGCSHHFTSRHYAPRSGCSYHFTKRQYAHQAVHIHSPRNERCVTSYYR